ncbi:L-asparaginase [Paenibacillus phyllosphaerae]|uniref:asparaginase n=1 Tax=Paenibacillus phyllosphaerae TaxID=274593 RepID=A0A7W5B3S0_9BACL|nr:asparaginase [Paenibacillus phyllosphaerae]MBB3113872.1 L-asparaginase [Paenibacillus phyllosphaerae]
MKRIHIFTTGGTIAMQSNPETGVVEPIEGHYMTSWLDHSSHIVMEDVFNKPSPHLTFEDLHVLYHKVKAAIDSPDIDGIVITHGTDTLEETAYYLDLHLPAGKPVVVTGAMRSSNEIGSDGPTNLVNAIRTAASDEASDKGVLVVFQDQVHAARYVTKTHTSSLSSFKSTEFGPIGFVEKAKAVFHYSPRNQECYPVPSRMSTVHLLKTALDMNSDMIEYFIDRGAAGLVIEAFGLGNVPPAMMDGIKLAIAKQIPVVLVSRCGSGSVQDTYGYAGGGHTLKEAGVIFSNHLNGPKARIKLASLLAGSLDVEAIRQAFEIDTRL